MDFLLNADQEAILASIDTIVSRHAGAERVRTLGGDDPAYDHELEAHVAEAGFMDLARNGEADRLDAALVVSALARGLGVTSAGFRALVGPSLGVPVDGPVTIVPDGYRGPVRFAADAESVVVVGSHDVRVVRPEPGSIPRVFSRLGWPIGDVADLAAGEPVDVAPAEVCTWRQVALAVELVGTMRFALDLTLEHVVGREQFGRAIGSFQAVQHGLAECAVAVEGAHWLGLEAAWTQDAVAAATALTHACEASDTVFRNTHQYSGALGFTKEYDLHLATMRLPALRAEAAMFGRPSIDLFRRNWAVT